MPGNDQFYARQILQKVNILHGWMKKYVGKSFAFILEEDGN
jgi:hypothetical protein